MIKLQRPRIGRELVQRPRLLEQLTAPAGYGNTTLLSAWLETCAVPSASLAQNGHAEEALQHALAAGDTTAGRRPTAV